MRVAMSGVCMLESEANLLLFQVFSPIIHRLIPPVDARRGKFTKHHHHHHHHCPTTITTALRPSHRKHNGDSK